MKESVFREDFEDGMVHVVFDRPGSSANLFDEETLRELGAIVEGIAADESVTGVVFRSAKERIFLAGADLNSLTRVRTKEAFGKVIDLGQETFEKIAGLKVPTVAAIHGAAPGGACELALACDYRIGTRDKATQIGLPEVLLGILPGWGGTARLPRLIGLPKALTAILTGKLYAAEHARKIGLLDGVVHRENLLEEASRLLARGKRKKSRIGFESRWPMTVLVKSKAQAAMLKQTRGHYPAAISALEITCRGHVGSVRSALKREREAFVELAMTPECANLMRIFHLQERAKKLGVPSGMEPVEATRVERTVVVGAGVMGAGIAQWNAARGLPVLLKDLSAEALAKGMAAIDKVLGAAVKKRALTQVEAREARDRITPVSAAVPMQRADLVIEAAVERIDLKKRIFQDLETCTNTKTVLATNTSALSIASIAKGLKAPERVVGIHFFNPVHKMKLVEVVRGPQTDGRTLATAIAYVKRIGKFPLVVNDAPGFLVNRVLMPYLIEAIRFFRDGVPVKEIDEVMLDFGMPMGPLRLADEVGFDVCQHVAEDLQERLEKPVPIDETLKTMMQGGLMGRKSGKGFYDYSRRPEVLSELLRYQRGTKAMTKDEIRDRLVLLMVNESARCLAEGVVESADDVDFGMIQGTGWAPFRGGPCTYAEERGLGEVVARMEELAQVDSYFEPCRFLRGLARKDGSLFESGKTVEFKKAS
ncbi:MAG: 3-hydroxyacyl-CoA dehydrogenase NAD-binding domain-containing protein [Verrucomicrobiota bacterium]